MLDQDEWKTVHKFYMKGAERVIQAKAKTDGSLQDLSLAEHAHFFRDRLLPYEEVTGHKEANPNVLRHHRLSLLGPPGQTCGKPLRTPAAILCVECGAKKTG